MEAVTAGSGGDRVAALTDSDLSYFEEAGLYEPDADDADDVSNLLHFLLGMGWTPDEIVEATCSCELQVLASDAALRPPAEFTLEEAAAQVDMAPEGLDHLRRSSGLAPRGIDGPGFGKADIEGFRALQAGAEMFTADEAHYFARVLGSSLSRIADAAVSLFLIDVEGPLREAGGSELDVAKRNIDAVKALDGVAAALDPLLRLHLEEAILRNRASRNLTDDPYTVRMAVGFVDLVGFTAFSERVTSAELGELVRRFEDASYDLVAEKGGRVVKLIGDEVMFVAADPQAACDVAVSLIGEFRGENVTPRGGLAYGELLSRGGDYYGPIVNLASRIGELAVPCELLATPELAERAPGYSFEPAGRRQLKGFPEPVELVSFCC